MSKTLSVIEYSVLKAASEMPELDIDMLDDPKREREVHAAITLADEGYLKNTGGISQEDYSFKITEEGRKCLEENETWLKSSAKPTKEETDTLETAGLLDNLKLAKEDKEDKLRS